MTTWLIYYWDLFRDRLWFIPSLYCVGAIFGAVLTLFFDREINLSEISYLDFITTTGASARIVLGSLIGALVTVVGLAFSLTMLVVAQMSSQYGPRLIRSLFDTNVTQNTLGVFLGTIVYSMIVLRAIRDEQDFGNLFTPDLSILLAELAGAACIFSLLTLTSHMTRCIRAETLIEGIYNNLISASQTPYPSVLSSAARVPVREQAIRSRGLAGERAAEPEGELEWPVLRDVRQVRSSKTGYLRAVDLASLVQSAEKRSLLVELRVQPGDFVHRNTTLVSLGRKADPEKAIPVHSDVENEHSGNHDVGSDSEAEESRSDWNGPVGDEEEDAASQETRAESDDPGAGDSDNMGGLDETGNSSGQDGLEDDDLLKEFEVHFLLGPSRTPRQDIVAAILEMAEIGVRSLSPGINDPTTAMNVIDYLASFIGDFAQRELPPKILVDSNGHLRLKANVRSFEEILCAGFDSLRQCNSNFVCVQQRTLSAHKFILAHVKTDEERAVVQREAIRSLRTAKHSISDPDDWRTLVNSVNFASEV